MLSNAPPRASPPSLEGPLDCDLLNILTWRIMGAGTSQYSTYRPTQTGVTDESMATTLGPQIVLIQPPALVADAECSVDIHISQIGPSDEHLQILCRQHDCIISRVDIGAATERTVSFTVRISEPCSTEISIVNTNGKVLGQKRCLLVLPEAAVREACELFNRSVDYVKSCSREFQADFFEVTVDQLNQQLEAGPDEDWLEQMVWKHNQNRVSSDLSEVLEHFWTAIEYDCDVPPIPQRIAGIMYHLIVFLIKNEAWATLSFLLKTCKQTGTPIRLGGQVLSDTEMEPEQLRETLNLFR